MNYCRNNFLCIDYSIRGSISRDADALSCRIISHRDRSRGSSSIVFCVCVCVWHAHVYIYIYATCKRIGVNLADRINLLNLQDKMFYAREKENMKWNLTNETILKGMIKEEGLLIEEKKRSKEEDVSSTRQAAKLTPLRQRVGRREHRITIYKRI